jgi:hypothetical protein
MLEKIVNPNFDRAVRHKAIGKQVVVIGGNDKGLTGYVYGHNYIRKTFFVQLVNGHSKNFASTDLVYLLVHCLYCILICTHSVHRRNRQCLDGVADGEPEASPVHSVAPRQATPMPDGPLVPPGDPDHEIWNVSPSDVAPVDEDWPMTPPGT